MRRLAAVIALAVTPSVAAAQYQITRTFTLGGDGSWDYVVPDPPHHRLFIGRQNRLMVVDENDGKLIGEVMGIHGAHGAAIVDKTGHGFATSSDDSSIVMFDLTTFKVLGRTHAAEDADAIIYDAPSDRVFSFNGDAHSATVVEPATGKLVTNIPLGGKPESGVSAGDGKVYVNITDNSEVVEIDAKAMTVTRRWSTLPCKQPVSMAIDRAHSRLFSGCRSGVMAVSDIKAGKVVATAPIGSGNDGAAFDPATGEAFFSNVDGTLTIVHQDDADKYHVVQNVMTARGGRNMGLDPETHRVFVVVAKYGPTPDSSAANPRRRPPIIPGSFSILVVERGR
ncbi:MAG TPA: PQQ-binding-like beta-propeller repeat protein [Gemmatimonadaceae bacterium]|jgi:DNA-binding beta-propeller fold protein YncE|nr:PQQ-binding-like beta-propeller repeat protein [Gemmatimonadaceae bacterium]